MDETSRFEGTASSDWMAIQKFGEKNLVDRITREVDNLLVTFQKIARDAVIFSIKDIYDCAQN